MGSNILLILIITIAFLGKANTVAIAAALLLVLKAVSLDRYLYPAIEKNGISLGIIILLMAILLPIANETISVSSIKNIFLSWIGITALLLSFFTTYLSGQGLNYLTEYGNGHVMPSLIVGAIISTTFLGGLPVGPFITCGMLVIIIRFAGYFHS